MYWYNKSIMKMYMYRYNALKKDLDVARRSSDKNKLAQLVADAAED